VLWAVQNNFFDDVAVDKVKDFQNKLTDFLTTRKAELLTKIRKRRPSATRSRRTQGGGHEFKQTYR
jgi:F-type H+-transporting ATPase subunit alpha